MAPSRRPLRIAFALVFFVGITTVGLAFLTARKDLRRPSRPATEDASSASDAADGGFFYKTIGQKPADAESADDNHHVKVASVSGYTVEFSAPTQQRDAEKLVDSLKTKGITAYYTPLSDGGRIIYRVRKGLYPNEAQAAVEAKTLAKVLGQEPRVVKLE